MAQQHRDTEKMNKVNSEDAAAYICATTTTETQTEHEDNTIAGALEILRGRLRRPGVAITSPGTTRDFLRLKLAGNPHEIFSVIWLDNKNRVIEYSELFRGTVDGASVHPREVVRDAIGHNAAAAILAHNHPSGVATPSNADRLMTRRLKDTLALIDVRVLDHIIIGGDATLENYSFAEHGEI